MDEVEALRAQVQALLKSVSELTVERDRYFGMKNANGTRVGELRAKLHAIQAEARYITGLDHPDMEDPDAPEYITVLNNYHDLVVHILES